LRGRHFRLQPNFEYIKLQLQNCLSNNYDKLWKILIWTDEEVIVANTFKKGSNTRVEDNIKAMPRNPIDIDSIDFIETYKCN